MSAIMTRWVIQHEHQVTAADLDGTDSVADTTVRRWVGAAATAYLDRCQVLHQSADEAALRVIHEISFSPPGDALGRPEQVVVTASAAEFWPASFRISVRIRPIGGDREVAVNATCSVRLIDGAGATQELGEAVRNELIALEHSAQHFN